MRDTGASPLHELSIAQAIVEGVLDTAERERADKVLRVRLRLGRLSGVVGDSLQFCYEMAVAGTVMEGSVLEIVELPLIIHCPACDADRILGGIQLMACPVCGTLSGDLRQGRELEIESIEIESPEAGVAATGDAGDAHGSSHRRNS
jgi:hydrogenase nickel incorporation protein HypA/HybF